MLVRDIVADADMAVPNSVPLSTKIRWLNEVQNEVFAVLDGPRAIAEIPLTASATTYPLPQDCPPDRILEVVLESGSGVRAAIPHADTLLGPGYRITPDGQLALTGLVVQDGDRLHVSYIRTLRPIALSSGAGQVGLDDEPDLPVAHHGVYVWGLAARIAAGLGDAAAEQMCVARLRASLENLLRFNDVTPDRGFGVELRW